MSYHDICIIGCGGHARSIFNSISQKDKVCYFIDSNARLGEELFGVPVVKSKPTSDVSYIIAVGDNNKRKDYYLNNVKLNYINVIAESAIISDDVAMGKGIFISHLAYIGPQCNIGKHSIINTGSILEHESILGEFAHLAPHSTVCGRCKIGNNVFIGANATVIENITICSNVIVGAGATVIDNITEVGIYCGTPARKIG